MNQEHHDITDESGTSWFNTWIRNIMI